MEHISIFSKTETGLRAEEEKKLSRRAALILPLLALAACDDDDDDDTQDAPVAMVTARNEGELVVSFTVQDAMTSGVSEDSFTVTVGTMTVTDAEAAVTSDSMAVTADSDLSDGNVVTVTFTSPTGALTGNMLDYSIGLADAQGGITIDGTAATAAQGMAFLGSAGDAVAATIDTDGPDLAAMDPTTGSGMMVTVTFDEDLLADSVTAADFTVTDADGDAVSVTDAMVVEGTLSEVVLTLDAAWADTHVISIAAGMIQDAEGVRNGTIPAPAAMDAEPTARNEGLIQVTFTIPTGTEDITMLSGADFEITAATGTDNTAVADVSDVAFQLWTIDAMMMAVNVAETDTVMADTVLFLNVTSEGGALTDNALDYTISLASDSNVMVGGMDLTSTEGMALATALTAMMDDYDTQGPGLAAMDPVSGMAMMVTITFGEELLESSVAAADFTVTEMDGTTVVTVSDAMVVSATLVELTLGAAWADTHVISVAAGAIQATDGLSNGALTTETTMTDTMTDDSAVRSEGEVVVSFTVQEAMTAGVSADSFALTLGTGTAAMVLTDVDVAVTDESDAELAAELAVDDVVVVTFTSDSGALASDALDYSVGLTGAAQGDITIAGTAATDTQGMAFLESSDDASKTGYDTKGPELEGATADATDATMVTVTFSEELHADSVDTDGSDFVIEDSAGTAVAVSAAALVAGMADEVVLTLGADWAATHVISVAAAMIWDTDGVSNAAIPDAAFSVEAAYGAMADTGEDAAFAEAADKEIEADEGSGTANLLFATVVFDDAVEAGAAGAAATDEAELAAAIFEIHTDTAGTDASNFEIVEAAFSSGGSAVTHGSAAGDLLGTAGADRGDFDSVLLTIHSTATGSDAAATDLYLAIAATGVADAGDGAALTMDDVVYIGSDFVAAQTDAAA